MATYSSNTTTKVNTAISSSFSRASTGTFVEYTAPATGYAIIYLNFSGITGTTQNAAVFLGISQSLDKFAFNTAGALNGPYYLGPGQSFQVTVAGGGGYAGQIGGFSFINTP